MANVTADEVRYRLSTLTSVDISDTALASAAFLPAGDAWLVAKGITFASLSANDQALAKAAEIAYVARRVVASAPVRGVKSGPIEIKPIPAGEKKEICALLDEEIREYLGLLDVNESLFASGSVGYDADTGDDDYLPDNVSGSGGGGSVVDKYGDITRL